MKTRWFVIATLALAVGLGRSTRASAQETPFELNLHVGGLHYDVPNGDTDALLGARMMLQYPSGWGWGGNFDWVNVQRNFVGEADLSLYLYSFEVDYTFPTSGPVKPFVGAGIGAATWKATNLPGPDHTDSETDALMPLAAGLKWVDDPVHPRWGIRGDLRDDVIFLGNDSAFGDKTQNDVEFSGGVSLFF